jgi:hypothetical protein
MNRIQLRRFIKSKSEYSNYVYGLYDQFGNIFYVGVGTKFRVCQHFSFSQKSKKPNMRLNIIRSIHSQGFQISAEILGFFYYRKEALLLERKLISELGRKDISTGVLSNLTDGGEGTLSVIKTLSEETKRKLSEINKGKVLSPEVRKNISEGHKNLFRSKKHAENLSKANSKIKIVCLENDIVFNNLREAEEWLKSLGHSKADRRNVHRSIKTKMRHCGHTFDYYNPIG